jgi:hypothetical protein
MFTFAGREGYFSSGPVLGRAGHNDVLCKTCNVLLCVLEQLRVDNSRAGPVTSCICVKSYSKIIFFPELWSPSCVCDNYLGKIDDFWSNSRLEIERIIRKTDRTSIQPIGQIAPNWAPNWSYLLSAVQVHTTTPLTLISVEIVL